MESHTIICIALLRSINVGGKNKLPMKDLIALFSNTGCTKVQSYIQSGNIIFTTTEENKQTISTAITLAIKTRFHLDVPVIIRSLHEFRVLSQSNPYHAVESDPTKLHVAFLSSPPDKQKIAMLDPNYSQPDKFIVVGRDIFLHLPNGMARTKLSNAWFYSRLGTTSTMRNWNTVCKLVELASKNCDRL